MHTWKINNWREILNEQLILIDESGLGDTASIHICNLDSESKTWFEMWKHSFDNDSYYLYLQNLGISWQETRYEDITANWRKWIMGGVIKNWKEYVSHLDEYDAVGDNWKDLIYFRDMGPPAFQRKFKDSDITYPQHYATQMWWTKSSHLSKLESPLEYQKYARPEHEGERVIMEGWLTSYGENFKEIRNDFTREPIGAYWNQHLKNMPK
jgi:hypothetical protein